MGYEEHLEFTKPPDEDATIWRYMGFTKFVSLLDSRSLYFCVVNLLEDKAEGTLPWENIKAWHPRIVAAYDQTRARTAVNCWHLSEIETALMWKAYSASREVVAIRSSFARLTKCFMYKDSGHPSYQSSLFVGVVKYVDFNEGGDFVDSNNTFFPVIHKKKYFEDEREVRALLSPDAGSLLHDTFIKNGVPGVYVPVDMDILIDRIFVGPSAPEWFFRLVKSLVREAYPVERSGMDNSPKQFTYEFPAEVPPTEKEQPTRREQPPTYLPHPPAYPAAHAGRSAYCPACESLLTHTPCQFPSFPHLYSQKSCQSRQVLYVCVKGDLDHSMKNNGSHVSNGKDYPRPNWSAGLTQYLE